ncbi:MAG: 5-(carboxyamino)imidazole ribonucleotide mutase [Clostridiales bacterium]|jgi:5-(carboxyamino)imidazole ribonucleotide mutase|nr:5-(carboxyamino)imidazole ribonucleotide mutase [Clostridiales bacterium]
MSNKIDVSICMGSDSDLSTMSLAAEKLEYFGIPYEMRIISAHRTPRRLYEYAEAAAGRGVKVIIAGAGGAAHLPGMVAALTTLPVIGVPVKTRALSGVDSLYSIVQMPSGVPVATVAIGGGENAGVLAASILGAFDKNISGKIADYKKFLEETVSKKSENLENTGFRAYPPH